MSRRAKLDNGSQTVQIRHITREQHEADKQPELPPPPPNQWHQFRQRPIEFLATKLFTSRLRTPIRGSTDVPSLKTNIAVVCVSDTHCTRPELPPGDLLLHAGDLSVKGTFGEIQDQLDWLNAQSHEHKVVIAGNHDRLLDPALDESDLERGSEVDQIPPRAGGRSDLRWGEIIYLQDSSARLEFTKGRVLNIYGSPWTIECGNWAFQYLPIRDIWARKIPIDTDILLTHGPPKFHLDRARNDAGCPHLLRELWRVRPTLAVFGHIHPGYGQELIGYSPAQSAYEGIRLGTRGYLALLVIFVSLIIQRLLFALRVSSSSKVTCLVNAAAVGGPNNQERRHPIVVEI
ncbi:MAG: hypothetical protein M4579_001726 [Chaenotheca gracillima]|nr:MAG: hypothetical protein M4579_001726 [Chaenotheca gracillima]